MSSTSLLSCRGENGNLNIGIEIEAFVPAIFWHVSENYMSI